MKKLIILTAVVLFLPLFTFAADEDETEEVPFFGHFQRAKEKAEDKKIKMEEHQKRIEERIEQMEEKKEEVKNRFCNRVETRIQNRVENYSEYKEKRVERHERVRARIGSLADKLDAEGYDTTQLREDLAVFDEKVKEYAAAYQKFIDSLEESNEYTCGESEGKFVDQVKESRDQLRIAREKRREIRQYYQKVIREDLLNLIDQKNS